MDRIVLTVHLLWQIWKARNALVYEQKMPNHIRAVEKAVSDWMEYRNAQDEARMNRELDGINEVQNSRWIPPKTGRIKVNTDAALAQEEGRAGWGVVARDRAGKILSAWAVPRKICSEAAMKEALAVREAMIMAERKGWKMVEFESDCKSNIDNLLNEEGMQLADTAVLSDIRKLKYKFDKCCFSFTKRENNYVSHRLAKFAVKCLVNVEWKVKFPCWLLESARADSEGQLPNV